MSRNLEFVRRPMLPVTLYALLAAIACERTMLATDASWFAGLGLGAVVGAMALCIALLVVATLRGWQHIGAGLVVVLTVVVALSVTSSAIERGHALREELTRRPVSRWEFVVDSDTSLSGHGYRCRAQARAGEVRSTVWLLLPERVQRGMRLRCVGTFAQSEDPEWAAQSRMQGVWATIQARKVLACHAAPGPIAALHGMRESLLTRMDASSSVERALLAGCVCGWKEGLAIFGLDDLFATCGVAHLVAVSGGHLSLLLSLFATLLLRVRMRPSSRVLCCVAVGGGFVLMCAAPVSAIRAWLMVLVSSVGRLCGRRSHGLSGVCAVGLSMTLIDPGLSGQLGFLLSVFCVCGLCVFSPYVVRALDVMLGPVGWGRALPRGIARALRHVRGTLYEAIATSLVCAYVTLPLTCEAFGMVSLVGIVANATVGLLFTPYLALGFVAATTSWVPVLGEVLLEASDMLGRTIIACLQALASLPYASISTAGVAQVVWVVVPLSLVILLVVWPVPRRRYLLGACACLALGVVAVYVRLRVFAPERICVLDVGQGDAILVQDGPHAVLVDAGPDETIRDALARNGVVHLDAIILSHLHEDHCAGVMSLVGSIPCEEVIVGEGVSAHLSPELRAGIDELTDHAVCEVAYGDVLHVGGFALKVVWPPDEATGQQNADSLMLSVAYEAQGRAFTGLLTGDAESEQLQEVLRRGDVGDIDFLKVGHHGSEVSITADQALALDPEVSVASAGEGNSYGHPTATCIDALESADSQFLCTKDIGDVEVVIQSP